MSWKCHVNILDCCSGFPPQLCFLSSCAPHSSAASSESQLYCISCDHPLAFSPDTHGRLQCSWPRSTWRLSQALSSFSTLEPRPQNEKAIKTAQRCGWELIWLPKRRSPSPGQICRNDHTGQKWKCRTRGPEAIDTPDLFLLYVNTFLCLPPPFFFSSPKH